MSGFGEATFVQAAGFLKINNGDNPLDATWIHPESYQVAARVLEKLGSSVDELAPKKPAGADASSAESPSPQVDEVVAPSVPGNAKSAAIQRLAERAAGIDVDQTAGELNIGKLLLQDILHATCRPGRDPRDDLPPPIFRRGIMKIEDLQPGMELTGTVLNVVDFGAFVDIGLSDSGLVHISRLADRFVRDPHEVVSVGDTLKVWVLEVDRQRRRVSLTAVEPGTEKPHTARRPEKAHGKDRRPKTKTQRRPSRPGSTSGRAGGDRSAKRANRSKAPVATRRKPKPVPPITKAMEEGREPMRTFGDLMQFYSKKRDSHDGDKSEESQ